MVGRSGWQITWCVASINGSVRALDFYPGGPGSNPIRDVGFFQTIHHFLDTNIHIHIRRIFIFVRWGSFGMDQLSHAVIKMTFS